MSIINNICEHGQLQRKCEVCDLKAEIARLRSVCRMAERQVGDQRAFMYPQSTGYARLTSVMRDLADAGKEPSDGL